jgi:hypothetical protein
MDLLSDKQIESMECLLESIEDTKIEIHQYKDEERLEIVSEDCGTVNINCARNSVSATVRQIFDTINKNGTIFY